MSKNATKYRDFGVTAAIWLVLLALAFISVAPILIKKNVVFAFNDGNIEVVLSPALEYPEQFSGIWDNQSFCGIYGGTASISITTIFETLLGPHHYRKIGVLLSIWLTGIAGYWCVRQFGRSRHASFMASILMMLCGWNLTFPMNGLTVRSYALAFSALSLGMIERGRKDHGVLSYILGGCFLGLAVSETPDVGLLFAIACAGYFILSHFNNRKSFALRNTVKQLSLFAVYVVASLFIAYQMVHTMFATQISGVTQGGSDLNEDQKYAWATQWSLPKSETWSLISCDFHGASSRSVDSPYWGRMGQSDGWEQSRQGFRNFRLAGYAIGVIPFMLIAFLYIIMLSGKDAPAPEGDDRRKIWIFSLLAVLSLVLSWGKYFPLYKLFYMAPYMGTIRNPDKWLGAFSLFMCLILAFAIDTFRRLRSEGDDELRRKVMKRGSQLLLFIPVIATTCLLYLLSSRANFISKLKADGFPAVAWNNAVGITIQTLIVFGIAITIVYFFLSSRGPAGHKRGIILLYCVTLLMTFELIKAGTPFLEDHDYRPSLTRNALTVFLDGHKNEGRIKLLPPRHPLLNNWRLSILTAGGYELFDPVSASRIPADYEAFFKAMGNNPLNLWRAISARFLICPREFLQELQKMNSTDGEFIERLAFGAVRSGTAFIPTTNVQKEGLFFSVVEFTGAAPLFRFVQSWTAVPDSPEQDEKILSALSGGFDQVNTAFVQGKGISGIGQGSGGSIDIVENSPKKVVLDVNAEEQTLMVRSSKYHPAWKVYIDGKPADLLRANYLFQGLLVPQGKHRILFQLEASNKGLIVSSAGRILMLIGLIFSAIRWRKKNHR